MERLEYPDKIGTVVSQFDKARGTTTLLRARFRSGKSGAYVALVDCQGTHDGVFVLKVDSKEAGEHEEQRHLSALSLGAFKDKIPKLIDTFKTDEFALLLLKIAGGSRIEWRPLVESLHIFASGYKALANALWSPLQFALGEQEQGSALVPDLLGYRLTSARGRIIQHARAFLGNDITTARAFHHLGEVLPNPIYFALEPKQYNLPVFRPVVGPCHGDCHAANLIVATGYDGTVRDIALIDLAYFSEKAPVFYDTSYLELATLLRQMDGIGQERWLRFTSVLAQSNEPAAGGLEHFERAWANDLFCGRKALQQLVDGDYGNRKDDLMLQMLLSQIAVGLAFMHKRPRQQSGSFGLSQDQYRQAFVWAAVYLKRFLEMAQVQWIPSKERLPPIGLQQREESDIATAEWRDLVRFDRRSFNVLILSPLARASNDEAIRNLVRLPWSLTIDLGTSGLSSQHGNVRQGLVRQAWPQGPPPDLSALTRGTLWYFANGRADIGEAPPASGVREWRQKYLMPLQTLFGSIAHKVAPKSVRSLVVGDDFPQDFFRLVLESLDNQMGDVMAPALVATESLQPLLDVPMTCAPLGTVLDTVRANQEPAEPDLGEGILLPRRTESGIQHVQVSPEFIQRIEKDLLVVHRALADWFPADRAFGFDFRRGRLIEWAELDNNLDIQRQMFPSLLNKVRTELSKSTNSTVNLLHEPSAGGSTLGRRVAWSVMEEYPVTLILQMSNNTSEYLSELFQKCGLPVLVVMEAEVVTESERELLFHQLLDTNTRAVFLWVSRIYSSSSSDVLSVELNDDEATNFQTAYEQNVLPNKVDALAQLTTDPKLREQRSPFFYGLTAFEDTYLGLDRLLDDIIKPLNPRGKDLVGDLALVSLYSSEGFPAAEFDELCGFFHYGERPFPASSPFTVNIGQHIKIPHRLIAAGALRALARVPEKWIADLGRFALGLIERLRKVKVHEADRIKEVVTSIFVTRDTVALLGVDTDLLAGGLPRQRPFAPLVHDIGSIEVSRRVLQRVFNEWPNEPHFAVHYARHLLYEEPREIDQAMQVMTLTYKGIGRGNETVVHTLGMCHRIRLERAINIARERKQTLKAIERQLEADSSYALQYFEEVSGLNPDSEYGHLSSIQTVSTLLRGAAELNNTDVAGLLKNSGHRWLVSALVRAEESINVLRTRPGTHISNRARRTLAEWALVYGQIEKVIQQLRALSDRYEDAGIRRALCSALLMKHNRRWRSVPDNDLQTITRLMERNIESNEFSDFDLLRWLRAYRFKRGFEIERAIERLTEWQMIRPAAVEPVYYLYVFYFLRWLNSGRSNRGYIDAVRKWLEVCRKNRPLGQKRWSYEWLIGTEDKFNTLHFTDLDFDPVQTLIGRPPEHSGRLSELARVEGTLSQYFGPQHALWDLGHSFSIHITPRTELARDHEGMRVKALISFSYDGPVGWDPELIS